jgi:iron complex transport system substrate-binding protein
MLGVENTLVGFRIPIIFHLKNTKTHWCRKDKRVGKTKTKYRSANWYATRSNCWLRIKQKQPLFEYFTKKFKSDVQWDWSNNPLLEKPNGLSFLVLYGLDSKANSVFSEIEKNTTLLCLPKATQPTVLSGRCSKINGTYHKATVGRLYF